MKNKTQLNNSSVPPPLIAFDQNSLQNYNSLIGIDEAGRGSLAGPVVASAVWLSKHFLKQTTFDPLCHLVNDSKQVSKDNRELLFDFILSLKKQNYLRYAISFRDACQIDKINIARATQEAFVECLFSLEKTDSTLSTEYFQENFGSIPLVTDQDLFLNPSISQPRHKIARIWIDGLPLKTLPYVHSSLVKGDTQSFAIALASILAKVTRDRLMTEYQNTYPNYTFSEHKGYGTLFHRKEINLYGPSPIHRLSFLKKLSVNTSTSEQTQLSL